MANLADSTGKKILEASGDDHRPLDRNWNDTIDYLLNMIYDISRDEEKWYCF